MARAGLDGRVENLIATMVDALESRAEELAADPQELVLATVSLAARMCLASANTGEARSMMAALCNNYFAQAENNFQAVQ